MGCVVMQSKSCSPCFGPWFDSGEVFCLVKKLLKIGCGFFLFLFLIATANLVLHQTVERIHVGKKYGDIPRGIFVVRGENVVLLGEIVSEPRALQPHSLQLC